MSGAVVVRGCGNHSHYRRYTPSTTIGIGNKFGLGWSFPNTGMLRYKLLIRTNILFIDGVMIFRKDLTNIRHRSFQVGIFRQDCPIVTISL